MNVSLKNNPKLHAMREELYGDAFRNQLRPERRKSSKPSKLSKAKKASGPRLSITQLVREHDLLSTFSARTTVQAARLAEIEREITRRMAPKGVTLREVLNTSRAQGIVSVR